MAKFVEIDNILDRPLKLPYRGKLYDIKPVSAEVGLLVQATMSVAAAVATDSSPDEHDIADLEVLSDSEERNLYRRLLGDTYDELIADGASWSVIKQFGLTAMVWTHNGEDAAAEAWNAIAPKAPQDRKPKKSSRS